MGATQGVYANIYIYYFCVSSILVKATVSPWKSVVYIIFQRGIVGRELGLFAGSTGFAIDFIDEFACPGVTDRPWAYAALMGTWKVETQVAGA